MNLLFLIVLVVLIGLGLYYFEGLFKLIPLFALLGLCYYLYIEPKEQKGGNNDHPDIKDVDPDRLKPIKGKYTGRSRTPVVGEQKTDSVDNKLSLRERIKLWWKRKKKERSDKEFVRLKKIETIVAEDLERGAKELKGELTKR